MIKATGLPRRIDHLGRIVVPVEMRRMLEISPGDELEISVQGDSITLSPLKKGCVFCGTEESLRTYRDKEICPSCASELRASFNGSHESYEHHEHQHG